MQAVARREFLRFLACSPLIGTALAGCAVNGHSRRGATGASPKNLHELEALAQRRMGPAAYAYAAGGSDDEYTLQANREAFRELQIRCRRLVDVSKIETRTTVLGQPLAYPILLAPVGFQAMFHPDGECETARGAASARASMIVSSVSSFPVAEVAKARGQSVWFQLYPTTDRGITRAVLERAEAAGCRVVALTVDTPVVGNRERHGDYLAAMLAGGARMGNFEGLRTDQAILDPSLAWDMIDWLRENCSMQVVIKGIVTREDARRCKERNVDAVIVSNHGGRQEESGRGTIECLPEVVEEVEDRFPVLIDGGVRRGTDVFKALALGAAAVGVGRPYVWGLAAMGADGVQLALEILQAELVRTMQLAGTPSLVAIDVDAVQRRA